MHDIGKLAMPDAILRKPAPLTLEEQDLIRQHPQIAAELIAGVPYLGRGVELVRDVHERIDGLGYPNGAPGADVALGARIICRRRRLRRDDAPAGVPRRHHPVRGDARARALRRHAVRPRRRRRSSEAVVQI